MDLADERFRLLITQICEDQRIDPKAYGSTSKIARALGLHPSTIQKFLDETRGAGEEARDKAARALGLDPSFFKAASLAGRPRYSDWQGTRLERFTHEMPGVAAFFDAPEHAHLARFRAAVNAELHSQTGDVPPSRVRKYVAILLDEEEAGARQFATAEPPKRRS